MIQTTLGSVDLHHAKYDLDGDIPVINFTDSNSLSLYLEDREAELSTSGHRIAFLLSCNGEIFISENLSYIAFFIISSIETKPHLKDNEYVDAFIVITNEGKTDNWLDDALLNARITAEGNPYRKCFGYAKDGKYIMFLQEYESYEAAYEVALQMREDSPICYEKENETP